MSAESETPKIRCMPNGPYYLFNDSSATVTNDGPYAITGSIDLVGVTFGDGASTEHYTLCRCGASKNKPFCDGSHWQIDFRDPAWP